MSSERRSSQAMADTSRIAIFISQEGLSASVRASQMNFGLRSDGFLGHIDRRFADFILLRNADRSWKCFGCLYLHGSKNQFEGDVKKEKPGTQSFLEAEQRKAEGILF